MRYGHRNTDVCEEILASLEDLHTSLEKYQPPVIVPTDEKPKQSSFGGLFSKMFSSKNRVESLKPAPDHPKGIYLYGDVGCGKTFLMDMFYTTVPKHLTKKRIHFHAFMQDVHKRSHRLHMEHGPDYDTAPAIADEIAKEANVLCFDEFQVTDVADAMILRRLISILYSETHGVVTFMTSNRKPDDLYMNGVQRASFIPCIEALKQENKVVYLHSTIDYRKIARPSSGSYFFPPSGKTLSSVKEDADKHAKQWLDYFCQGASVNENEELSIWGRPLVVPKSAPGVAAQFTFDQLCGKPLSAADYLELTRNYNRFVVTDIPLLSIRRTDLTRRFITFLDAAYESHSKLAVTAERPFEHLFIDEGPIIKSEAPKDVKDLDDPDSDFLGDGTMFSGEEEKFAFSRALSRLKQMSSKQWLDDGFDRE
ncbi:Afg1p [Sugiyamaella lignohabitans]|uniref:Afg1p n=1 Tax=Sugiyamaella lignohabitans TaxID=796027 RepID=A0A167EM36_9ASCO|nr:Afg1p [Sugiyamaella lignohabitans]ANB14239.1 Afg1p [Sugiyamaella lignohabitans]